MIKLVQTGGTETEGLTRFYALPVFQLIGYVSRQHGVQQSLCLLLLYLQVARQHSQFLLETNTQAKHHIYVPVKSITCTDLDCKTFRVYFVTTNL